MRSLRSRFAVILVAYGLLAAVVDRREPLLGCAPAPHRGEWVDIRDESALIIWDASTKTEHFIRRASFETKANDFGFLVPTPSQPELGEVNDKVFGQLGSTTAARHIYETKVKTVFGFGDLLPQAVMTGAMAPGAPPPNAAASAVEVLAEQQVAGFDATVLKANDAQALSEWLDKHGYEARPALTEWLSWYVENNWIITAFRLTKGERPRLDAKSVRMTFKTERPFYPYREPADMRNPSGQGSRMLRVFVLADQRLTGTIGQNSRWPGIPVWANDLSGQLRSLFENLNLVSADLESLQKHAKYLTEFEDRSFPRPGTDEVYLSPSEVQSSIERPPIVHKVIKIEYWPGPWGLVVLMGCGCLCIAFVVKRLLSRKGSAS